MTAGATSTFLEGSDSLVGDIHDEDFGDVWSVFEVAAMSIPRVLFGYRVEW